MPKSNYVQIHQKKNKKVSLKREVDYVAIHQTTSKRIKPKRRSPPTTPTYACIDYEKTCVLESFPKF